MTRPAYDEAAAGVGPGDELAALAYRSRLLGGQADLVVHGGGNTSVKLTVEDPRGGERELLYVKASGHDLATIAVDGFAALDLAGLRALRPRLAELRESEAERETLRCLADPSVPARPSIETLLHAFVAARHVDHVHADAICTLTNGPGGESAARDALGAGIAYVSWMRSGPPLAVVVGELGDADAIVLAHHGLVTFGASAREVYERTIEVVQRAERWLAGRRGARPAGVGGAAERSFADEQDLLLTLRGRLSDGGPRRVLHVDRAACAVADRADVAQIATAGPSTADHVLHIRTETLVVGAAGEVPTKLGAAVARYDAYVGRNRDRLPAGYAPHDPRPAVALVPGLGAVAAGRDAREATVRAEVAAHSHAVAARVLDAFGAVDRLPEADVFDIDYWPAELAKQAGRPAPRELEGRVFVVTGAASGIGRACARLLCARGAHVVGADRDADRLEDAIAELRSSGGEAVAVTGDLTDTAVVDRVVATAVLSYGGVDGAVANAGVGAPGRLTELTPEEWRLSLEINATSHFLLLRRLLRALATQGIGGSIVVVASKNAFSPGAAFGAYSVAKAAQVQLARVAALEAGSIGVRVNVVNPDAVFGDSRLWSDELRAERAAAHGVAPGSLEAFYAERSLLGVPVRGEDVAEAVAFLLGDRSSRTTGCVLTVDGGVAGAFPR